ncbi:TadE family type IV pilus minor pilin [Pseudarthrobacter sp. J75]|uniref:TadE family type IV pilus minor pilin n=2 Tax=Pseudarthrobacter TaxID=1742993 RepID=UPI002E8047FB|nr:TadE family type IV pilus minor pilin [Pseudarthrobacter sp. J75]MEE2522266.1 TadE family type IV pilus minor pilin [Pseudarthrobacter sp. J47]MEE2528088.1 TadE family type IV pilus minor pilin [Pseudarthrobacter sp. J75]
MSSAGCGMGNSEASVDPDPDRRAPGSRGAVTAEFAVVLPAVLFLLALLLAGAAAGVTQLRLEGAARSGARELARGEDAGTVTETVRSLAGATAVAAVSSDGGWSTVTVSDRAGGLLGGMVPWTLSATATARTEAAALPAAIPAALLGWSG